MVYRFFVIVLVSLLLYMSYILNLPWWAYLAWGVCAALGWLAGIPVRK